MGFKLAEGKGLREGWDSKELWKSVGKIKSPTLSRSAKDRPPETETCAIWRPPAIVCVPDAL